MRGGFGVRGDGGLQVDQLAGLGLGFGGVDESVAARPDGVFGVFGQIGDEITAAIVGDHFFDVARGEGGRFGDYPDAGFGAFAAGDDAADVVGFDLDLRARVLGIQMSRGCEQCRGNVSSGANDRRAAEVEHS